MYAIYRNNYRVRLILIFRIEVWVGVGIDKENLQPMLLANVFSFFNGGDGRSRTQTYNARSRLATTLYVSWVTQDILRSSLRPNHSGARGVADM